MVRFVCGYLAVALLGCAATAPAPTAGKAANVEAQPRAAAQPGLRLPVDGTWVVVQGYQSRGSHRGYAAYALDFVKLDDRGRAHARSGRRLSDWYGFGAEVLASADGVVVRARDHFPDNTVLGKAKDTNTIIVRHGAVFSEYVHLQQRSLRFGVGDRVRRGDVLARVGNSGCETPHLHWALLSSIDPIQTHPARFDRYEVRDVVGAWQAATGVPSGNEVIRYLP